MNFREAAILGNFLSKDYAKDLFKLLLDYNDISASEAASRLSLHIKTAQDFFEAMYSLGILSRKEVYEKKRPYYRYRLIKNKIEMTIDLDKLFKKESRSRIYELRIRERKNAGARFSVARNNQYISSIVIWHGEGRNKKEKKINLTTSQGMFMYNLPFPSANHESVEQIMKKSGLTEEHESEILNIVDELILFKVIEKEN